MKIQYKDYRLGHHVLTVKYVEHKDYTHFKVMPWHLSPMTRWERIKEQFKYPVYIDKKWYSTRLPELEATVIHFITTYFKT